MPMTFKTASTALVSVLALSACGSSASITPEKVDLFAPANENYAPVFDDGIAIAREVLSTDTVGEGITGFASQDDGSIKPFSLRISTDGQSAFLSIDGAEEIVFDTVEDNDNFIALFNNETTDIDITKFITSIAFVTRPDVDATAPAPVLQGRGVLRTPTKDLPTGTVSYSGSWEINSQTNDPVRASFSLDVGFASGNAQGEFRGNEDASALSGTITGQVRDGLFAAEAIATGEGATADLDMLGAFSGNGIFVSGAIAGKINGDVVGGSFNALDVAIGD